MLICLYPFGIGNGSNAYCIHLKRGCITFQNDTATFWESFEDAAFIVPRENITATMPITAQQMTVLDSKKVLSPASWPYLFEIFGLSAK